MTGSLTAVVRRQAACGRRAVFWSSGNLTRVHASYGCMPSRLLAALVVSLAADSAGRERAPRTIRCATTPAPKRWPCASAFRTRRRACISRPTATAPRATSTDLQRDERHRRRCATTAAGPPTAGAPANASSYRAALGRIADGGGRRQARGTEPTRRRSRFWLLRTERCRSDAPPPTCASSCRPDFRSRRRGIRCRRRTARSASAIPPTPDDWIARVAIGNFDELPIALRRRARSACRCSATPTPRKRDKLDSWIHARQPRHAVRIWPSAAARTCSC